jgi:hypothetical protein
MIPTFKPVSFLVDLFLVRVIAGTAPPCARSIAAKKRFDSPTIPWAALRFRITDNELPGPPMRGRRWGIGSFSLAQVEW